MQVTGEKRRTPSPWPVFAITSLAVFAVLLDALIVIIAFPTISRAFSGTGVTDISWVVNAYTIVYAALLVPAGRLADLVGRKRVFLSGVVIFTVFSGLSGAASSLDFLISFRVLQAVGGALLSSTGLALILAAFPRTQRVIAVTLVGAIGALAVVVGPTLGASIVEYSSWRWIFYVNLPVGALVTILGYRVLSESRDRAVGARPDLIGILLTVSGAALVTYGILQSGTLGWANSTVVASILVGGALLLILAVQVRHAKSPVVDPSLFRDRSFTFANASLFVFSIGFTGIFFSSVYFLTEIWHYSLLWTGLAMIPPALMVVGLAPLAGRLAGRFGHRSLAVPGGVIFAAGQASLWYRITSTPSFVGVWLPSSLATGIGIAFVLPVLMSAFAQNLPAGKYAVGSGVGNAFRQFGSVIGAALAISYLSVPSRNLQPFDHLWAINILAGIGASLLALGLPRGSPPSVHDVTQAIRPGASRSSSTGPAAKDENESTSA